MKVVIEIDGKKIPFEANGNTPRKYQKQFGKNYFEVASDITGAFDAESGQVLAGKVEMDDVYNLLYTYAHTADGSIGDIDTWLSSFDSFPIVDLLTETMDLTLGNLVYIEKKK